MRVARKLERRRKEKEPPRIDSFADFLTHHARVKSGPGYIPYHFAGREALRPIVERLDQILASGETDASLAICGGALTETQAESDLERFADVITNRDVVRAHPWLHR